MTRDKIFEKIKKIAAEQLDVDEKEITIDSDLREDLGADSLDAVELIMALEVEFNREIPDEDAEGIKSIRTAVDYICGKLGITD